MGDKWINCNKHLTNRHRVTGFRIYIRLRARVARREQQADLLLRRRVWTSVPEALQSAWRTDADKR